jgi:2-isopropylmalate synthase
VVQPNKAIVGANAFAHEAGIHQDGVLKMRETYEIMDAEMIGLSDNKLVLGKHSGRHAFGDRLKTLGYELSKEASDKAFEQFKALADKKKEIHDEDLHAIVSDEAHHAHDIYTLKSVSIVSGTDVEPSAKVSLGVDGKMISGEQHGTGPVDALYKTISTMVGVEFQLVDYIIQAVTGGTDALGEVTVRIQDGDSVFTGRGSHTDVMVASAKAYVMAINKMLYRRTHAQEKAQL